MRELVPAWPPGACRSSSSVRKPSEAPYTAAARPADAVLSRRVGAALDGVDWASARTEGDRITLEEALRCGTMNGAYASFEENIKGTIEPGKLADLVVLTKDPFKTEAQAITEISVERTMAGGKWVYES